MRAPRSRLHPHHIELSPTHVGYENRREAPIEGPRADLQGDDLLGRHHPLRRGFTHNRGHLERGGPRLGGKRRAFLRRSRSAPSDVVFWVLFVQIQCGRGTLGREIRGEEGFGSPFPRDYIGESSARVVVIDCPDSF